MQNTSITAQRELSEHLTQQECTSRVRAFAERNRPCPGRYGQSSEEIEAVLRQHIRNRGFGWFMDLDGRNQARHARTQKCQAFGLTMQEEREIFGCVEMAFFYH